MADYISRHASGTVVDDLLDKAQAAYDEKHTHDNADVLSKFGEADGQPTFEGSPIRGEPGPQGDPGPQGIQGEPGPVDNSLWAAVDRLYTGVDLTVKFTSEISGYSSVWAWIKARIQATNYDGIHVGDYIPFTLTDGKAFKAEIAGIDTYYRYGDQEVGHHIDFITRDCHPDTHVWNKVNYNNGLAAEASPWLCSDLYAWLNAKAMDVPNAAAADPATTPVDYTANGILALLPSALSSVIIEKRLYVPTRQTTGQLLKDDNNGKWANVGKLWIPFEVEVYGCGMRGTVNPASPGFSTCGFVQYPIFGQNMKRIKGAGNGGSASPWWLASAMGNNAGYAAHTGKDGTASAYVANSAAIRAPLCFRIAQ